MSTILIFCAHSDDEAIGMAGTIFKYVEEGKEIIKVVFSHGEKSHPHLQESHVKKERKKETKEASEFIGIKETVYLGLKDSKLKEEVKKEKVINDIRILIKDYNPEKIYCPTYSDNHPTKDHQAVNETILNIVDTSIKKYPVYAYEVWNIGRENHPYTYSDISEYMDKKLEYIKTFKSQWVYIFTLYLPAIIRAKVYGLENNVKYAERFYKLR